MADVQAGREPDRPTLERCMCSPYPGTVAYAGAAAVLAGAGPGSDAYAEALARAVQRTQGIKGRPQFLRRALAP